jgi:dGTPase
VAGEPPFFQRAAPLGPSNHPIAKSPNRKIDKSPNRMTPTIREQLEERERLFLAPEAAHSVDTRGRLRPQAEDDMRPAFQRDRDRIIHCKAFRRLKHKTQVFFLPTGDHYRTRLTHTLEVSQIARTIAKSLRLNEDLTEAIALGHDLGHTPFGHWGERVLAGLVPGGFSHTAQSLRVVDVLERDGQGLNLTFEVRDGIARHSKGKLGAPVGEAGQQAQTLEGQCIRIADLIAYVNHDIDDAIRAGLVTEEQLPREAVMLLGHNPSRRIGRMVRDVVATTLAAGLDEIRMSEPTLGATLALRAFLFQTVYENDQSTVEFRKTSGILGGLWDKVCERPEEFLDRRTLESEGLQAAARDFVAGMTDRYAVGLFERLYIPRPWVVASDWERD